MDDRYPYIRLVVGAAPLIAGALAGVTFLGGAFGACSRGGFAGILSFLISAVFAGICWVGVMVSIESLQLFLDIEDHTRHLRPQPPPSSGTESSPGA